MLIGIVLPTHNRKDNLRDTLELILKQTSEIKDVSFQVVVVIDGSTDGTIEMMTNNFKSVHIVMGDGNLYYTKSMNKGYQYIQQFNPDYVLSLNDDIILKEDYIRKMIESIGKVEQNSIIGCISLTNTEPVKILFSGEKKYIRWRQKRIKYHRSFEEADVKKLTGIYPTVMLPGRGMMIPNKVLTELNFFDPFFAQYHSDTDFCLRASKKGYKIYVSWDAQMYSLIDKTEGTSSFIKTSFIKFLKSFFNKYSRVFIPQKAKFYWRHGSAILWPVTMMLFFGSSFKAFLFNKKLL